jgi:hypothetical protein
MPKPKKGKKSGSGGDASHEMDPDWHKVCAVCDRCVRYCAFAANVQEIVLRGKEVHRAFCGFAVVGTGQRAVQDCELCWCCGVLHAGMWLPEQLTQGSTSNSFESLQGDCFCAAIAGPHAGNRIEAYRNRVLL